MNWLTLDEPDAGTFGSTYATAISGNKIVGWYNDSAGGLHGFLAMIVPEPSTLFLVIIATFAAPGVRYHKRLACRLFL